MDLNNYLRPRSRLKWSLSIVALALLVPALYLLAQAYANYQEVEALRERNVRLAAKSLKPVTAKINRSEHESARLWTELKRELDFPWLQLFQTVERAASKDIELLGFQPDSRNRRLILRGQALNSEALLTYLNALSDQRTVSQAYLVHQQAIAQDKLDTVGFEIKLTLK